MALTPEAQHRIFKNWMDMEDSGVVMVCVFHV